MQGLIGFDHLLPEIGTKETRTITLLEAYQGLPPDNYAFLEFYCTDSKCDCRRVLLNVLAERRGEHLATISYAFEPPAPYSPVPEQIFLDPFNPQSQFSKALLGLFERVLLFDRNYVRRLERHYRMVKEALADPAHAIRHHCVGRGRWSGTKVVARHRSIRTLPLRQRREVQVLLP